MTPSYFYLENAGEMIDEIPPDSILSRTLFEDENVKAILFGFAPGQELSEHTASVPAVIHFLQGEAQLTFDEEEREAQPGTWVHMAARRSHSIQAQTEVLMLLYLIEGAS